jgi:hypothetical protein
MSLLHPLVFPTGCKPDTNRRGEPKRKKAGHRSQMPLGRRKLGDENLQIATALDERAKSGNR